MSDWHENLPDVRSWQPRTDASEQLTNLFLKRCRHIEERILLRARSEKEGNIDNFDSGLGVEEIIREELSMLLPSRYSVRCGVLDDRYGRTVGDCDVVIFNELWFPFIKAGASEVSRRFHFPIEGVYAVLEVKTSLDYDSLDDAMSKLVACHRLHRPTTPANRVTENSAVNGCPHGVLNPLYSGIIATSLRPGLSLEDLSNRFFTICKELRRHEVVRSICVLGHGSVEWGIRTQNGEIQPATFRKDYELPIIPVFSRTEVLGSALYSFASHLLLGLYHAILSPEDLYAKYGPGKHRVSAPKGIETALAPGECPQVRDPESPVV